MAVCPERRKAAFSSMNVEKVVKPPQNPVASRSRRRGSMPPARPESPAISPSRRHPATFTAKVAHGNPAPPPVGRTFATRNRETPPQKLPQPTSRQSRNVFMATILPERRRRRKAGLSRAAAMWYDTRHDTRRARREGRIAEHGLSLLVDTGAGRLLFDAGAGSALARNAAALGIEPLPETVVLSHGHNDHTGGLPSLSKGTVYAAPGVRRPRLSLHPGRPPHVLSMPATDLR